MYLHKLLEVAARVLLGNISERHLDDFLDFFFLTAKVSVNWSIHKISWGLAICVCEEASHNTFELSGHRLLTGRCPRRDWPEDLSCRLFILSPSRRSKQMSDSLITCALADFIFDEITSQSSFLTTQREAVPFQNGRWAVYDKTWSLTFLPKIVNFLRGQLPIALQFKYRSNVLDLIIKWNSTAARWDNFPDCGYQLHACCSCNGACELKLAVY